MLWPKGINKSQEAAFLASIRRPGDTCTMHNGHYRPVVPGMTV